MAHGRTLVAVIGGPSSVAIVVGVIACASTPGGSCGPDENLQTLYASVPATIEDGGRVELSGRVTDAHVPPDAGIGATVPFPDPCAEYCPDPTKDPKTTGHLHGCDLEQYCDPSTLDCPLGGSSKPIGWALRCYSGTAYICAL